MHRSWCCSVPLQYFSSSLCFRIVVFWENSYHALLTTWTFFTDPSSLQSYMHFNKQHDQRVMRSSQERIEYKIPKLDGQHPWGFGSCNKVGSPSFSPLLSQWQVPLLCLNGSPLNHNFSVPCSILMSYS